MEFCPNCGKILEITEMFLTCSKCNFSKGKEKDVIGYGLKKKKKAEVAKGVVTGDNPVASYEHICSRCGYGKAEAIIMGPYYSDEDTVIRFRCGKCGNTESMGKRFK